MLLGLSILILGEPAFHIDFEIGVAVGMLRVFGLIKGEDTLIRKPRGGDEGRYVPANEANKGYSP